MLTKAVVGDLDLARWRLRTQHLVEPHLPMAVDVVGALLGVQAENPAQSAWAVAARTAAPDPADLARLLDDGTIVRTHVLRPTWHYVAADDVTWLIELTAPRSAGRSTADEHGARDERQGGRQCFERGARSARISEPVPTGTVRRLAEMGWTMSGQALMHLLADLELQTLVCSGRPTDDGTHTYARFADRVPSPRRLDRANPSPNWRCAISPGMVRRPSRTWPIGPRFHSATCAPGLPRCLTGSNRSNTTGGRSGTACDPPETAGTPAGHLLQILDEMYRGYQESRWVLDGAGIVPRARETAAGMALVDGQIVAAMKRSLTADRVVFDVRPYRRLSAADLEALEAAAARYGWFLGRTGLLDVH